MVKKHIYMDHNATTPLHPEVKSTMKKAMDVFGNPSSLHSFGRVARKLVEEARVKVASFINAEADEVIFTGSGSEANNTVLSIFACMSEKCAGNFNKDVDIITTEIEHPCVIETSKCLEGKGASVHYLKADCLGKVNIEELKSTLKKSAGLVSVMMANNEIGTIQDIKEIAKIAHESGALFHTDAVQAAGKIPVDVRDLDCDFLTLSAHKLYGPKGVGALYVKKGVPFCPLIRGGHQERGRRAGTENTLGIIGFGKASEMRVLEMPGEDKRLLGLVKKLKKGLDDNIKDVRLNGHPIDCLPNTLNVSFDGAEGEAILLYLDQEGLALSTGSACASGSLDPSHVLLATGMPAERAHSSIRISFGRENTEDEVDYLIKKLKIVIEKIRGMSTAYSG